MGPMADAGDAMMIKKYKVITSPTTDCINFKKKKKKKIISKHLKQLNKLHFTRLAEQAFQQHWL